MLQSTEGASELDPVGTRRKRLLGLDVLRGVAILLVLLRHSWPDTFGGGGIVGVVVFFTLSGYLITGVLDRDLRRNHRISYGRFYAHRFFRLVPALVFMLSVFAVCGLVFGLFGNSTTIIVSVLASLLYLMDLPIPIHTAAPVNTLWTLAVEEQFYLVWPMLLAFAFRRNSLRLVLFGTFSILALTASVSAVLAAQDLDRIYSLPTSWASTMVVGAIAYYYRDWIFLRVRRSSLMRRALAFVAMGMLIALSLTPDAKHQVLFYVLGGPAIAAATVLLIAFVEDWDSLPTWFLAPLRWLGLISYAVYLWNVLVQRWLALQFPELGAWAAIPVTIAVAIVSWFTVEAGGRRLRQGFDARSRSRIDGPSRASASDDPPGPPVAPHDDVLLR